jgi:hypothetical protein
MYTLAATVRPRRNLRGDLKGGERMQASPDEFLLVQFSRQGPLGMRKRCGHLRSIKPRLHEIPGRFCHSGLILAALSDDKRLLEQFLCSCQVQTVLSRQGRQAVQCNTFYHWLVPRSRQDQQLLVDALCLSELTA